MSKMRQQRHSEELRKQILEITQKIIVSEGIDAVSIRRVANELDYTAPIIYHYFRDKTQLLSCAIQEGYMRMLEALPQPDPSLPPDERLRLAFKYSVDAAVKVPQAYRSFILNFSADLLAESNVVGPEGQEQSATLAVLKNALDDGVKLGLFGPCDTLLTAKVWWAATFGLFARIIVEPELPENEREALITRQLDILMNGIKAS
jgi:AcrR family transcriptional regulator